VFWLLFGYQFNLLLAQIARIDTKRFYAFVQSVLFIK